MTLFNILDEADFIAGRTAWLKQQPHDTEGKLLRRDDRDECALLYNRLSELQAMLAAQ